MLIFCMLWWFMVVIVVSYTFWWSKYLQTGHCFVTSTILDYIEPSSCNSSYAYKLPKWCCKTSKNTHDNALLQRTRHIKQFPTCASYSGYLAKWCKKRRKMYFLQWTFLQVHFNWIGKFKTNVTMIFYCCSF